MAEDFVEFMLKKSKEKEEAQPNKMGYVNVKEVEELTEELRKKFSKKK